MAVGLPEALDVELPTNGEAIGQTQESSAAERAGLKLLADLDGLRASVEDPDGYISFVLGFDGRLLDFKMADAVEHVMTNLT